MASSVRFNQTSTYVDGILGGSMWDVPDDGTITWAVQDSDSFSWGNNVTDFNEINSLFNKLQSDGKKILQEEGFELNDMRFRFGYDLRYRGQQWDVKVILDKDHLNEKNIKLNFEKEHEKLFGHIQPNGLIEITKIQLVAIGKVPKIAKPNLKVSDVAPLP